MQGRIIRTRLNEMHGQEQKRIYGEALRLHPLLKVKQKSPAVARKDTPQPIHFLLQYWPLKSSTVDDFHVL